MDTDVIYVEQLKGPLCHIIVLCVNMIYVQGVPPIDGGETVLKIFNDRRRIV